jgi:hypothetical protein
MPLLAAATGGLAFGAVSLAAFIEVVFDDGCCWNGCESADRGVDAPLGSVAVPEAGAGAADGGGAAKSG